jgi:hypothetical protein
MADDRRIILGSYAISKKGDTLEDGTTRKWTLDSGTNTILGGKSINTTIAADQVDNNWYKGDDKGTEVTFEGAYQLRNTGDSYVLQFLYIKNLNTSGGVTITVTLAGEGEWNEAVAMGGSIEWDAVLAAGIRNGGYWNPDYFIEIPPEGSVMFRGDGVTKMDAVHVNSPNGESKIEYIIAK